MHTIRIRKMLQSTAWLAVLALAVSTTQGALYTAGHADIGVGYEGGALIPHWHLHAGAVVDGTALTEEGEYTPGELIAFVPDPSVARPTGTQWDFLGNAADAPLWFLPQANDPSKPFLGIASEELVASEWTSLTLSLVSLTGPSGGHFSLYQTDPFGTPAVKMASSDGITGTDAYFMNVGGHDHYNFAFTEPGRYEATFQWSGELAGGGLVSATETFGFQVTPVPEPGTTGLIGAGVLGLLAVLRRKRETLSQGT